MIALRTTNYIGVLCGESQPMCRYSDATVAKARELRSTGMSCKAIAEVLRIKNRMTVWRWLAGRSRKPAARIVAKRIHPELFIPNHQQQAESPAVERDAADGAPAIPSD